MKKIQKAGRRVERIESRKSKVGKTRLASALELINDY